MRRLLTITISMFLMASGLAARGEVVDRIIAIVNNNPVLLSEWDEAWRCEALLAGRTPESYSQAEQQEVFNRLVDQELLRQQMRGYLLTPVTEVDLQSELKDVRKQLAIASDADWQKTLDRTGITQDELAQHLRRQIEIERFVDLRF